MRASWQVMHVVTWNSFSLQARKLAKKKKEHEMRGGGANEEDEAKEGGEEEHDFEDDEIMEVETTPQTITPPSKRLRKKTSVESIGSAASSSLQKKSSHESLPSPVLPRRLSFDTPTSSAKKQMTLGRFFKSTNQDDESKHQEEAVVMPPKKTVMHMEDTIKALIRSGKITVEGTPVQLSEEIAQDIKQQVSAQKSVQTIAGGRPSIGRKRGVGAGSKSNVRKKHERPLKHELPAATKHQMCQTMYEGREQFPTQEDMLQHWAKQFKMPIRRIRKIYAQRSQWQKIARKHKQSTSEDIRPGRALARGVHGAGKQNSIRKRAEGGGSKKEFPEVFAKVKARFESERCHGHQVLQRHLGWKYEEYMHQELEDLKHKVENENHAMRERHQLEGRIRKAEKQIESMKKPKGLDQRASRLVQQLDAKIRAPNLITQLHPIEEQVRAEISWQYMDWQ